MTKWITVKIKPPAYEPVFLALTRDDYTTGHWASKVGHWVGYALNQTPPIYVLEEGAVKYWAAIEPPKGTLMKRTIEVETSMFDPDPTKEWSFGCDGYVVNTTIEYPSELNHLSDDELAELADDDKDVHYIKQEIKLGDEVENLEGMVSGVVYRIEDELISFIDEHVIRYRMSQVRKCAYLSGYERLSIIKKYKIGLTLVRNIR